MLSNIRTALSSANPGLKRNKNGTWSLAPTPIPPEALALVAPLSVAGPMNVSVQTKQGTKTAPGVISEAVAARMAKVAGLGQKSYISYPLGLSQLFDFCDWVDGGLVMQPKVNGEGLTNWIGRVMVNNKETIKVPIWDFRSYIDKTAAAGETTLDNLMCNPPNASPSAPRVKKCEIDYCLNDKVFQFAVPMHKYSEFRERCEALGTVNIFGQTFDPKDPESMQALDRARTMIELKYKRTRVMVNLMRDFVDDFADAHPELAAGEGDDCAGLLPPTPIDLAPADEVACEDVEDFAALVQTNNRTIWTRMRDLKQCISRDFDGELRPEDFLFVMNANEALCIMWAQTCINFACANTSVSISVEPRNLNESMFALEQQFTERLRGGKYGWGYLLMPDGSRLDIWADPYDHGNPADPVIPAGEAYLFVKSWGGAQPNPFALFFYENNYTEYINYYNGQSAVPRVQPLGVGNAFEVLPINGCDDRRVAFSAGLLSNAPWAQTKFENICGCTELAFGSCIPSLPNVSAVTPCDPINA